MLPNTVRILVCTEPQDMRRSFDRLAEVVRSVMGEEPMSGTLFVFVGKRPTRVKVLWWDRNGFCLLYKRLHRALFVPPPASGGARSIRIDASALSQLLAGVSRETKRVRQSRLH
jgi:transposase